MVVPRQCPVRGIARGSVSTFTAKHRRHVSFESGTEGCTVPLAHSTTLHLSGECWRRVHTTSKTKTFTLDT